jgi:hypothetical protein
MAECCGTLRINLKWSASLPSVSQLTRKCGSLNISQPYRLPQTVTGIVLPFFLTIGARQIGHQAANIWMLDRLCLSEDQVMDKYSQKISLHEVSQLMLVQ